MADDNKPGPAKKGVKQVGAAKLTIEILRCLAKQRGPVGVSVLAKMLDRYPGTVYAVLKTLQAEGVVDFLPDSKTYRLCMGGVMEISNLQWHKDVPQRLRVPIRETSERFGLCFYLSQRVRPDSMIIVDSVMPDRPLGVYAKVGFRIAFPMGGMGRLLIGYESTDEAFLADAYKRVKWINDSMPFEEWAAQVRQDRLAGYAYEEDTMPEGMATIAVPIIEGSGPIRFTLNAIGLRSDFAADRLPDIIDALRRLAADAVSPEIFS